jgi:hypothetical protein
LALSKGSDEVLNKMYRARTANVRDLVINYRLGEDFVLFIVYGYFIFDNPQTEFTTAAHASFSGSNMPFLIYCSLLAVFHFIGGVAQECTPWSCKDGSTSTVNQQTSVSIDLSQHLNNRGFGWKSNDSNFDGQGGLFYNMS